jgi:oligopeptide/dipeptide ABC transporter ATP-binding protein
VSIANVAAVNSAPESEPLLRVSGLTIGFPGDDRYALAADRVEFSVAAGETLGIVGESACGKSVSLRALLGIVPVPGRVLSGTAIWKGDTDLLSLSPKELRNLRGNQIAMIFQDPQQSLNPVYSIGGQLTEVLRKRAGLGRKDAHKQAVQLLDRVGIPSAERRFHDHPHQLSGGMRQRVMIAIAISCNPALLLADEPTTALDVTIQDQILALIADLQAELGMSVIMVSHDFGVVGQSCTRIAVMYSGRIVESGDIDQVLSSPRHPYTVGLLAAVPRMPGAEGHGAVWAIPGQPPTITALPTGCSFRPRCPFAKQECEHVDMTLDASPDGHRTACPFAITALDGSSSYVSR